MEVVSWMVVLPVVSSDDIKEMVKLQNKTRPEPVTTHTYYITRLNSSVTTERYNQNEKDRETETEQQAVSFTGTDECINANHQHDIKKDTETKKYICIILFFSFIT